jgi:uncharacterized membrane protein YphA (DoxX/SURF4 family)
VIRRLARPLLGIAFVSSGLEALQGIDRRASRVAAFGASAPATVSRTVAATQIGAGVLLGLNRLPRLSALVLALTVVPEAATGHDFWSEKDPDTKRAQRSLFARDLGLLGGLMVATIDTGGRESVPHRARRKSHEAANTVVDQLT